VSRWRHHSREGYSENEHVRIEAIRLSKALLRRAKDAWREHEVILLNELIAGFEDFSASEVYQHQ